MTVRELINELERFEDDDEVCIGMYQNYGTNFVMEINEVEESRIHNYDDEDDDYRVMIIEGRQFGSIDSEEY